MGRVRSWLERELDEDLRTAPEPELAAKKTWRYLRLAMVAMVLGLGVSILHATWGQCWQGSISAYYYTPAQGFLVGALVTIGVCLFALKGNTDLEDALLNLAGVCAPFVALVPTDGIGDCGPVIYDGKNRADNIANNVLALLVVLTVALIVVAILEFKQKRKPGTKRTTVVRWAFALSTIALAALWWFFYTARVGFALNMHDISAIFMFVFIFFCVLLNARHLWIRRQAEATDGRRVRRFNRYYLVALIMFAAAVLHLAAIGLYALNDATWKHAALSIEAWMIGLFALFWLLQTFELWHKGLRRPLPEAEEPPVLAGAPNG